MTNLVPEEYVINPTRYVDYLYHKKKFKKKKLTAHWIC